jgi:hypothetical protein
MVGVKRYALFLQSRCAYACGNHERSAFGQKRKLDGLNCRPQCRRSGKGSQGSASEPRQLRGFEGFDELFRPRDPT